MDRFRKQLTSRASTETTADLHSIYTEEAQTHSDAALLYSFASAESVMRKARRKATAVLLAANAQDDVASSITANSNPTLSELATLLRDSTKCKIKVGSKREDFFQDILNHDEAILFFHERTVEQTDRLDGLQVSASYSFAGGERHLLTVHSIGSADSTPLIYAIIREKSERIYSNAFAYIRDKLSNLLSPAIIVSDFDPAIQAALMRTYPEATIKGNWHEYVASVTRQCQEHRVDAACATGNAASALKMILVLPFLPADYMVPGLDALQKWMTEKGVKSPAMAAICRHVEETWLRGVGAGRMSIFRAPTTTSSITDHARTFYRQLEDTMTEKEPTVWHILDALTLLATKVHSRLARRRQLASIPGHSKHLNRDQVLTSTIIRNATEQWIRQPIHLRAPFQFLQMTSHFITEQFFDRVFGRVTRIVTDKGHIGHPSTIQVSSNNTPVVLMNQTTGDGPPPLVYFTASTQLNNRLSLNSEPPPLVPISR